MNKVHRKITALLTTSFMTVMSMGVVSAQTDNNAQIKSIDAENGTVTVDVQKAVVIKYMRRYIKINYYKDFIQLTVSQAAECLTSVKRLNLTKIPKH